MPERSPFSADSPARNLPDERSFRHTLRRATLAIALGLGIPALAMAGLVLYLFHSAEWVERADRIITAAHDVQKLTIDMETGLRGFQVAPDEKFLEPFTASRAHLAERLTALSALVADAPEQGAAAAELQRGIESWTAFADDALRLQREGGDFRNPALQLHGKQLMDSVRARHGELVDREMQLRSDRVRLLRRVRVALLVALALAALAGVPVASFWLRRLLKNANGAYRRSLIAAHAHTGELDASLAAQRDAETALRQSEQRLRFLSDLADAKRTLADPAAIMATSARMLGQHLRASRCAYAEVAADSESFVILDDYADGCASSKGRYQLSLFGPRTAADLRAGRTLILRDVERELAAGEGAEAFHAIGVKAIVCCPLIKDGSLRAMMAVHQTTPRDWSPLEISLVEDVVERCWATMERARAESEVRERARLSSLRADVAAQLASGAGIDCNVQTCCELLVQHLDAAFARVWTLAADEPVLELRASAGLYTHLDGPHARVPVGQFKIGRIAQSGQPHLTNDVAHDPNVSDPDWAKREGMTAFAGYPLAIEGRILGVLAMFARHPISQAALDDLAPIADAIAQCVERKRAVAALGASEQRLRQLADAMPQIVWMARPDGYLDYFNRRWYEFTGRSEERGGDEGWLPILHPDDVQPCLDRWYACVKTGEDYEIRYRFRDYKTGAFRWFLGRALPVRDPSGQTARWFGTCTDIDDIVRAESAAQLSREKAEQAQLAAEAASKAKDNFLAALSHELRTPLTPVLLCAATLRDDERLPADARETLSMMERNIALEARLIDDLLDVTRIAKGKLPLRLQPCDAHSLIGLAVEIVRDDAKAKGITIERSFAAHRSGLMADPARFQQVIWNLLRNAVKFTPVGGRVSIRTTDGGAGRLHIEVADSGIGIAPEVIEQIFLPFEQGELTGSHRFGGVGLGLAIARAIVDLHGGTISAESDGANLGATFIVELPDAIDPPPGAIDGSDLAPELFPSATAAKTSATDTKPLRLLLVEDHEATLQVLSRLLTRAGHSVVSASTMSGALAASAAGVFDLVISDLGLPDGSGTELMGKLRDTHGLRGIALSGYGMEEDLARSRDAGFVTHLIKPVDFPQLQRAMREATESTPISQGEASAMP